MVHYYYVLILSYAILYSDVVCPLYYVVTVTLLGVSLTLTVSLDRITLIMDVIQGLLARIGLSSLLPSNSEDVPSIHSCNKLTGPRSDTGKRFCKLNSAAAQVILENLEDVSSAVKTDSLGLGPGIKGVLGSPSAAVGGKLVSAALVTLYGGYFKDDNMKQVLAGMKDTIRDELEEMEIDKALAAVKGLERWLTVELPSRKDKTSNWSREEIWKDFYPKVDRLRKSTDLLMSPRFKSNKGLFAFLPVASLHLASLKDLAQQDHRVMDWTESAHYKDLKKRAVLYAEHAEATTDTLQNQRAEKVKIKLRMSLLLNIHESLSLITIIGYWYKWVDTLTEQRGYSVYCNAPMYLTVSKLLADFPEARAYYKERVDAVKERLNTDLGDPIGTAKYWRQMGGEE